LSKVPATEANPHNTRNTPGGRGRTEGHARRHAPLAMPQLTSEAGVANRAGGILEQILDCPTAENSMFRPFELSLQACQFADLLGIKILPGLIF
jgi:hypothetical protein